MKVYKFKTLVLVVYLLMVQMLFANSPTITSTAIANVNQDSGYNYTLTGNDADGDSLSWSVKAGTSLPSWLSLYEAPNINTIAGVLGTYGASGDGGLATSAKLENPYDVAVDSSGNIYIADYSNHAIRKVDATTGNISTVVGTLGNSGNTGDGGLATSAKLENPTSVAIDNSGNIYIADKENDAIRKVDVSTGNISTVAGTIGSRGSTGDGGIATSATLDRPSGVTVDSHGNIYIADTYNKAIRKVDASTGIISTVAGTLGDSGDTGDGGPATDAKLNYPIGVVVDSSGNIYIADTFNHAIRKVDATTGNISTVAGTLGSLGNTGDNGLATSATLNYPEEIAVDSNGNIYIADTGNHAIRKVDATTGKISTVAGTTNSQGSTGDGGLATSAKLYYPKGVSVDSSGNIYIVDYGNTAIRKVDAPGMRLSGTPTSSDVGNHNISLILSDGTNEVEHNFTITVNSLTPSVTSTAVTNVNPDSAYSYTLAGDDAQGDSLAWSVKAGTSLPSWLSLTQTPGNINTIAGTIGSDGGTGDGDLATIAKLQYPTGVAVDSSGNIYIADYSNHVIRKVDATTGNISTVAGTLGTSGDTGDGGVATSATLDSPTSVAIDSSGNIYIADKNNHAIRKVDATTGIISTVAGTLGTSGASGDGDLATIAKLQYPAGVAVDSSGNIHIADSRNHAIRKVDATTGNISTVVGTLGTSGDTGDGGSATSATLNHPYEVTVDSHGNIYITDYGNHVIRKVDVTTGIISTVAGTISSSGSTGDGGPATSAKLNYPKRVVVDSSGNIYIADTKNHAIRKVDATTGNISTVAGTLGTSGDTGDGGDATDVKLNYPTSVAIDSHGNIYIADTNNHAIRKVDAPGMKLSGTPASSDVGNHNISLILSDGTNEVEHNFTITVNSLTPSVTSTAVTNVNQDSEYNYTLTGDDAQGDTLAWSVKPGTSLPSWLSLSQTIPNINTIAGILGLSGARGDGDLATSAKLYYPYDVAVDSHGNIYISDYTNHVIRKVNSSGIVTTVAGTISSLGSTGDSGLATSAKLSYPMSVAIDSSGNIYIADTNNHAIRKVDASTGIISTVAGILGAFGNAGDGGVATNTTLNSPVGVVVDSNGNIYIADAANHAIRKVDATTGNISTVAGILGAFGNAGDGGLATSAKLNYPQRLAIDSSGNIYIADKNNHAIRKVDASTGNISTVAGTLGALGNTGDGGAATSAKLTFPEGVAVDLSGNIYITDSYNHAIRKVDATTGNISTVAGTIGSAGRTGDGGLSTSAKLNYPKGIAVDSSGNIYIADKNNHAIRKVDAPDIKLSGTPASSDVGNHNISLILSDGTNETEHNFSVNVANVNDVPTTSTVFSDITTTEDNGVKNHTLNISDIDGDALTVTVVSSNTDILTVSPSWSGVLNQADYSSGLNYTTTPVENANGTVSITITVTDTDGLSIVKSFDIEVSAVNDKPTLENLRDKLVYKNFDDINDTLPLTDVDGDILTYTVKALDDSMVNLSLTDNIVTLKSIEGQSGTTDVNITVSDSEYSVSKTFKLQILSLEDGDDIEEKGKVNVETNNNKTITTVTVPEDNLTLKIEEDTNGTVAHKIVVNDKTTSSSSDINGSKVEVTSSGVHTTFSDENLSLEVNATIIGKAIHSLTTNGKTTKASCEIIGAKTVVSKDENGSIEIITSIVLDDNTSISVTAKANGNAEHKVSLGDKTSYTKVDVSGGETTIANTGVVTTVFKTAQSVTSPDGKTKVELNNSALLDGFFEIGSSVTINIDSSGNEFIEVTTPPATSATKYIIGE